MFFKKINKGFILFGIIVLCSWSKSSATETTTNVNDSILIQKCISEVEKYSRNTIPNKTDFITIQRKLNQASDIASRLKNFKFSYTINSMYNKLYLWCGNVAIAMNYNFKSLDLLDTEYKTNKDTLVEKYINDTYNSIAIGYFYLGSYNKSITYLDSLNKFLDKSKLRKYNKTYFQGKVVIYNNLASIYTATQNYRKSKFYHYKALRILNTGYENLSYRASIYNNLGIIAQQEHQLIQAENLYFKALSLWTSLRDTVGLARVYNNFGSYYSDLNNEVKAIQHIQKAFVYSKKTNNLSSEETAASNLAQLYEKNADYEKALFYKNISTVLKDSLMNAEKVRYVTQLEVQYQFEKQKKEEEIQKKIQDTKELRRVLIFSAVILILLFISIVFILLFRNQQFKNREMALQEKNLQLEKQNLKLENKNLTSEIEFKNKELATNVLYLLKKNEFISSISEKLLSLKLQKNTEDTELLKSITKELQFSIDNQSWNEFELRFQNVHKDFLNTLSEKFPDLSPNEIKICSFLRLNMSTKDISSITFQSTKSIEVARTRLRKKMNLERDENLILFLQKM